MLGNLGGWTAVIILVVIVLLFGATKLPALAKSVGQSMKIFKSEMKSDSDDETKSEKSEAAEGSEPNSKS